MIQNSSNSPEVQRRQGNLILAGIALGITVGIVLGSTLGNFLAGLVIGEGLGLSIGIALDWRRKGKLDRQNRLKVAVGLAATLILGLMFYIWL